MWQEDNFDYRFSDAFTILINLVIGDLILYLSDDLTSNHSDEINDYHIQLMQDVSKLSSK